MERRYEIIKEILVLPAAGEYTKEVNLVSWNGASPKLDIRTWLPNGNAGKGILLNRAEAKALKDSLTDQLINSIPE